MVLLFWRRRLCTVEQLSTYFLSRAKSFRRRRELGRQARKKIERERTKFQIERKKKERAIKKERKKESEKFYERKKKERQIKMKGLMKKEKEREGN